MLGSRRSCSRALRRVNITSRSLDRRRLLLGGAHRHSGGGVSVGGVERLGLEQCVREAVELVAVVVQQLRHGLVSIVDEGPHLLVDLPLQLW